MATTRVETVTVLFTDLVDSTGLRVRVGEEEADRLRGHHDRLVSEAIAAHGGRIAKHTGDGVMATFDGASDAVSAAVAIQQAIDAGNRRGGHDPVAVRIGLSVGDVSAEGGDCFGLPVVEAQRLESAARPGQILCASLVRALARGRGGHQFRSVGDLDLKGLPEAVAADEVLWEPVADPASSAPELPPVLQRGNAFAFAGRDLERASVLAEWEAVQRGATRIVLLAGEPGVGKTRLASELAEDVLGTGGAVLAGRCDELLPSPYQPFAEALRWQLGQPGGTDALGPLAGELVRLAPELADLVSDLPAPLAAEPDAERVKLFDAVHGWLAALAAAQPVLLVLDDLHWADHGSLLLLRHVAMNTPVPGLLVLATYRDTDVDRQHPLSAMLAELRRRADVTRLSVEGLDEAGVAELLQVAAGHELGDSATLLARQLHDETAGNPFFVSEVLRHLAESGAIERRDGAWVACAGADGFVLPEGVRDVVGRRLSVLPEEAQKTLRAAAVVGSQFDLDLLSAVAGGDEDDLLDALDRAIAAHLVQEVGVGSYRFAHALVRSTLHQELSSTRRSRLHRRVAEALESTCGDDLDSVAAELAYHWSEAHAGGGAEQALTYARRAAEIAYERLAPDESARWYRQALELLDGADRHLEAELTLRLAEALVLAGAPTADGALLDAARLAERAGDIDLMTAALAISRRAGFSMGMPVAGEKIDLLERALAMAPADDVANRAVLLSELAVELIFTGDDDRRCALREEARRLLPLVDDARTRVEVRGRIGRSALPSEETLADYREFVEEGAADRAWVLSSGDVALITGVLFPEALMHLRTGDLAAARESHAVIVGLAQATKHPRAEDSVPFTAMLLALVDGDLDEAERQAQEMHLLWTAHNVAEGERYFASIRTQVARERGQLPFLADALRARLAAEEPGRTPRTLGSLAAVALCEAGRFEEAYALVDEHSAGGFADIPEDQALFIARPGWADAAARSGHRAASEALHGLLSVDPEFHQATGGWYLGSTTYYLGLLSTTLGRDDEARHWYEQAVAAHERMPTPPWLARTLVDWAILEGGERRRELGQRALDVIGDLPLEASRQRALTILGSPDPKK